MTHIAALRRVPWLCFVTIGMIMLGGSLAGRAPAVRTIDMLDICDPATFNEVMPELCAFDHPGVTFDHFLRVLEQAQTMGAWHFAPGELRLKEGQEFQAHNSGGEAHTFTEVAEFGGGFILELNELIGEDEVAPECANPLSLEFIPPGGTTDPEAEPAGTHLYMCCIHPWMRTTVTVR